MRERRIICTGLFSVAAIANATSALAQANANKDTVDVAVGSPLVNTSQLVAHQTRAVSSRLTNGTMAPGAEVTWSFSLRDSAGASVLHIESALGAQVTAVFSLDRKTLAPLSINGATPQLPAPAFLGGLADLMVESLPRRVGTVYRVNTWRRGMPSVEPRLYETTGREDIDVFGKSYRQAWVVDERNADGSRLLGRLWLMEGPPYLVRWMIYNPDGSATQLDQEVSSGQKPNPSTATPTPAGPGWPAPALLAPTKTELSSPVTVPARLVYGDRPTVQAMINGRGPYLLSIETGGPYSIALSAKAANELGLEAPNGAPRMRAIDSLTIGGLTLHGMNALVRNEVIIPGVDGLLGLAAFRDLLLTIDYPRKQVRFELGRLPEANGRDVIALERVGAGALFAARADVAGRDVPLIIDTQSGGIAVMCNPKIADSLRFAAVPVIVGQAIISGMTNDPVFFREARLDGTVRAGAFNVERPVVDIAPMPAPMMAAAPICTIGSEVLKHFAMTLDQHSERARFSRGGSTIPQSESIRSFGLTISNADSAKMAVVQVVQNGGAAEKAGVRAGDEVVSMNGQPPSDETTASPTLRAIAGSGKSIHLRLRRSGRLLDVTVAPIVLVK